MTIKNILITTFLLFSTLIGALRHGYAQKNRNNQLPIKTTPATTNYEAEAVFIKAEKYYILGDYEKALGYFRKAAKLAPTKGTIYYKIAEILSTGKRAQDVEEASANIEKALELQKDNEEFYLLAAYIYSKTSNFSKASQVLEMMIKEVDNTERHLYLLGEKYQSANKMSKAIKTYNQAETILGISEKSSLPKEKIYLQQGKIKEAVGEIKKLTQAFPSDELYTIRLAELFLKQGQLDDAITTLIHSIGTQKNTKNSTLLLIKLYRQKGQEQKAREAIQKLFETSTIDIGGKVEILNTYMEEINQPSKATNKDTTLVSFAMGLLSMLKKTHPTEPETNIVGGDLYLVLKQLEKAKKEYQTAIKKGSTHFKTWQNMLYLESELEQFDSLVLHTEKGLELFPGQAIFYYLNGYAHMQKKNYEKAIYSLRQAKKLARSQPPLVAEINQLLGDIYHELKEYQKSDNAYNEALLLDPENHLLLNNYSYYLALRKANLDKAEKMAARAVNNSPTNNAYLDTYAWVLFVQGKYKKALKVIQNVIQTNPQNPVFFDHYGDILFKMGNVEDAVAQWEKAQQKGMTSKLLHDKITNKKLP